MTGGTITNNSSKNGGGVYTKPSGTNKVIVTMSAGIISWNNASKEGGGIQITDNMLLLSETEAINNNVHLKNNSTLKVENPYSESETGDEQIKARIDVTVEDGYSNIVAANDTDYSSCFIPDLEEEWVNYDDLDKIVKIDGRYTVTFDCGDGTIYDTTTVNRNMAVPEPTGAPTRAGSRFGGWYIGDTPYDFTKPVFGSLTLTAKWLEEGKFGISITPSKIYIMSDNSKAYGAAYKDGILTDITMKNMVDYGVIELSKINLNMTNADTISLFVWDENQAPLCEKISFNIGG